MRAKFLKNAVGLSMVILLSGCSVLMVWTHLPEGEYRDTRRGFTARVPKDWMRFNPAAFFVMTRDGTTLDRIVVEKGRLDKELEFTKKKFRKDMQIQDMAELEIDNLKADENRRFFQVLKNQPATVSGRPAFEFAYAYETPQGMPYKGRAYGFMVDDHIYRIVYEAAAQHDYQRNLEDFERFMESFRLIGPADAPAEPAPQTDGTAG